MKTQQTKLERRDCELCNASVPAHDYDKHLAFCKDYRASEVEGKRLGAIIARVLQLKHSREHPDRYNTSGGTKTDLGLFRTVKAIMEGQYQ